MTIMIFILKYCFGIGVLIFVLNTLYVKYEMIKFNQGIENDEIKVFIKWYGVCITIPLFLIQIFQILGNYQTCFYLFYLDFNNIYYVMAFITTILFWALLIYMVIIKNGAEIIAKYNKVFINYSFIEIKISANLVKIIIGLMVLIGLIVLLFGNKIWGEAIYNFEDINKLLEY